MGTPRHRATKWLACIALIASIPDANCAAPTAAPRVLIVTTGGTIATPTASATAPGQSLVDSVQGLEKTAKISVDEFDRIPSSEMTPDKWLRLAKLINESMRADQSLTGVVITHGTDTMEETAYFLDLTLGDPRAVVLVGSMRSSDEVSADGPGNLLNAVRVACDPAAAGRGVLVTLNEEILAARDIWKSDNRHVETFQSRSGGPVGTVDPDGVVFFSKPARSRSAGQNFDIASVSLLPRVELLADYAGFASSAGSDTIKRKPAGLVIEAFAGGRTSEGMHRMLEQATQAGIAVVIASRVPRGRIVGDPLDGLNAILARDLPSYKARVLLMLALTQSKERGELQRIFDNY